MGIRKGCIYGKGAPFKGRPRRLGVAVAPNFPPGFATDTVVLHGFLTFLCFIIDCIFIRVIAFICARNNSLQAAMPDY